MDKRFLTGIIITSVIYLILFRILYATSGSNDFDRKIFKKCNSSHPCLPFCHTSNKSLTNDFLKENFPFENEENININLTNLRFVRMSLSCRFLEEEIIEEAESYFEVLNIGKNSNSNHESLKCLTFESNSQTINIENCKRNFWITFSIQIFFLLIIFVLLLLPLAAFIMNLKVSNTVVERHLIALLTSLILMMLTLFIWTFIGDLSDLEAFVGFAAPILVLNFMSCDIFLSFKQFQKSKFNSHYLIRFGSLLGLFIILIILLFLVDIEEIFGGILGLQLSNILILFLVVIYIINILIMLVAGIFYMKTKESVRGLEHPRFEFESARFGLYVVLFGITSITWLMSIIAVAVYQFYSYVFFIIVGVLALYSSILIAFITLLWFKNSQPLADTKMELENGKVY